MRIRGLLLSIGRGSPELSAAIVWQHASARRPAAALLPSGRIRMKDCVFRRVGVGIESRVRGAIALEIVNSLHLGPGPMIRLTHAPAADEPVGIHLSQVTVREANALLDCRCRADDPRARSTSRPPVASLRRAPRPHSWCFIGRFSGAAVARSEVDGPGIGGCRASRLRPLVWSRRWPADDRRCHDLDCRSGAWRGRICGKIRRGAGKQPGRQLPGAAPTMSTRVPRGRRLKSNRRAATRETTSRRKVRPKPGQ